MSCCGGGREKEEKISATHKWDYINLSDFKSTSCFTPFSYGILYITLIISIAVYVVDIYVAINLLLYNQWAGQIKPFVSLDKSRWIFAGCIVLSLVLLVYRWINAIKTIRSGGVAQSYLDPLAVRLQSIRMGQGGHGYRRFLVFAELTKSKKGAEYIALFTYFSFEAWIQIIFAEGPRKVINAMTLYNILTTDFIPGGVNAHASDKSTVEQFFINVKYYAEDDNTRAAVIFSMLFTLLIWVFAALSLLISCIFYILFLWHHIPQQDGILCKGLRRYCKRKIDGRLQKIVDTKVNKALAKEDAKLGLKPSKHNDIKRQPTLPVLADEAALSQTTLARQDTQNSSRSGDKFEYSVGVQRPGNLTRMDTNSSTTSAQSYNSNAPLIGAAGEMGSGVPRPYQPISSNSFGRPPAHAIPQPPRGGLPTPRQAAQYGSGPRPSTSMSNRVDGRFTPGPPLRQNTGLNQMHSAGHSHPALSNNYLPQEFEMRPQTPRAATQPPVGGFVAYNPTMNRAGITSTSGNSAAPPRSYTSSPSRNFTTTPTHLPPRAATTGPPGQNAYDQSYYNRY